MRVGSGGRAVPPLRGPRRLLHRRLIPWQHLSWCFRSNDNYPAWLANDLGVYDTPGGFTDASCSFADTTKMTRSRPVPTADIHLGTAEPQLDARTLDTDLVTVGIGCNDYCAFSNLIDTLSHGS